MNGEIEFQIIYGTLSTFSPPTEELQLSREARTENIKFFFFINYL